MYFIRLLKIRCHLCQQFVGRYPDIDREAKLLPYPVLYNQRRIHGRRVFPGDLCKIHVALINTDLFDLCCKTFQIVHQPVTFFTVHPVVRRYTHEIRTLTKGIRNRFPRANAIFFSGN